jgi:alpha-L-glutamate ligase-like protein
MIPKSKNVLGMNARNLIYIRPNNKKSAKKLADDKLRCKRVLKKAGVPVPKLIKSIKTHEELDNFDFSTLPNSFVLKPNFGFGGEGILVVYGKKKGGENIWIKADRSQVTEDHLRTHIKNILDGSFSRIDTADIAFFEERIQLYQGFKPYAFRGVPDIRVLVYNRVPVMAMVRIPTEASGGTSNLHRGGIGVGVDMTTGVTTTAIQYDKVIEKSPKGMLLSGIKIPQWKEILELAIKSQDVSKLGYLGADIAIDRENGPVFMELNARPGLSIQVANQEGLITRLNRVEGLKIKTVRRGVALAQNLFGGEIEEEIEGLSGKRIISTVEKVKTIGRNRQEIKVEAKIDTGASFTSMGLDLARELGFGETIDRYEEIISNYKDWDELKEMNVKEREELFKDIPYLADMAIIHSSHGTSYRPLVEIKIVMDKRVIPALVTIIDREHLKYPMIIGKRNLKRFLVEVK